MRAVIHRIVFPDFEPSAAFDPDDTVGPIGAMVGGYLGGMAGKAMGSGLARLFHW